MLQFVKGDLQSADLLNHVLSHEGIDTVMHFAAQVPPPPSLPLGFLMVACSHQNVHNSLLFRSSMQLTKIYLIRAKRWGDQCMHTKPSQPHVDAHL